MKQRQIAAVLAEFLGTLVLVLVVLNVVRYGAPFFTAIAAAVTVATFYTVAARVGAGHFNPAVTIAMVAVRRASVVKGIAFVAAQFLAGVAGWKLGEYLLGRTLENNTWPGFDQKVFLAELIGTFVFVAILTAAVGKKMSDRDTGVTIGAGLFVGSTVAGLGILAGGVLNPAIAFGTHAFDWTETMLAPILGGLLGAVVVELLVNRDTAAKVGLPKSAAKTAQTKVEKPVEKTVETPKPAVKKPVAKKSTAKKVVAKKK